MSRSLRTRAAVPLIAGLSLLAAGCATTNEALVEEITRTEASIQQVQQSGQTREAGGLELEQAKDKVARARRALENGDESTARRMAVEARLDADLAEAKANSHSSQQAVDEVMASIEALRRETDRQSPQTVTSDASDE
jgi:hypothetical protein